MWRCLFWMLYISVAARLQGNEENYFWKCCLSLQIKIGYQLIFNYAWMVMSAIMYR